MTKPANFSSFEFTKPSDMARFSAGLFAYPLAEQMLYNFATRHCQGYQGGMWRCWVVKVDMLNEEGNIEEGFSGYMMPEEGQYKTHISDNYFEGELSASAFGIVATLFVLNRLSWMAAEKGHHTICCNLIDRQDALKDFVSLSKHPEAELIFRAID